MTVGEKIQYYRKKNGFSQEELGQKILVSRQTISLWEMDKTLPTLDNLIRLKEIFGVSIDELLSLETMPMEVDLADNSVSAHAEKGAAKTRKKGEWKVGSILLLIFSLFSPIFAVITVAAVSGETGFIEEYYWVFFLYLLIPFSSILYGALLKKRKYKVKKNVVVGAIMTAILCMCGLLFLAISLTYSHSDALLIKAEKTIGVEIPEYKEIHLEDPAYDDREWRKTILARCTIYFDEQRVAAFEREMSMDDRWLTSVATRIMGIVPSDYNSQYEYILIYNTLTAEFNTLPNESGEYPFMMLLYDVDDKEMEIVEYVVEFVA